MNDDNKIYTAYEGFKKKDSAEPERNLMRSILRTAMDDIRKRGEQHRDARRYFLAEDDFYVFSFMSICHHLELCPKTIRTLVGLSSTLSPGDDSDGRIAA